MSLAITVCVDPVWLGVVLKSVIHLRGGVWQWSRIRSKGVSRKRTLLRPVRKCKEPRRIDNEHTYTILPDNQCKITLTQSELAEFDELSGHIHGHKQFVSVARAQSL